MKSSWDMTEPKYYESKIIWTHPIQLINKYKSYGWFADYFKTTKEGGREKLRIGHG